MVLSITTIFYLLSLQSICKHTRGFAQSWLAVMWAARYMHLTRTSERGINKIKALPVLSGLLVLCVSPHHNKSPFHVKAIPVTAACCQWDFSVETSPGLQTHAHSLGSTSVFYNKRTLNTLPRWQSHLPLFLLSRVLNCMVVGVAGLGLGRMC